MTKNRLAEDRYFFSALLSEPLGILLKRKVIRWFPIAPALCLMFLVPPLRPP
jgi:hypothetical protein